MFTHSIRWRLQIWLAFLLVCVLTGFGAAVYQLQRINLFKQIDEELERRLSALDGVVRGPPPGFGPGRPPFDGRRGGDPGRGEPGRGGESGRGGDPGRDDRPPGPFGPRDRPDGPPSGGGREFRFGQREIRMTPELLSLFDVAVKDGFYFVVWSREGSVLKNSTNAPVNVPLPTRESRDTRNHIYMRDSSREAYHFTEIGECVLTGRNISTDLAALQRFIFWLLAAGGTVLTFGLGGGWWLTTRAIRPIEEISAAASRISAGNLSERISGTSSDNELGQLAGVLNSTFARLDAAFAQQKQFTADASHELRTPLAVLISEAQTTLARERTAAEYRDTVEACLDTAQQMRKLTESLLELARFDAGQEQEPGTRLDLSEIAKDCVKRLSPLAGERGLVIRCELAPARIVGHADRLGQVVVNLLTNAIHYNKPQGEIRVMTRVENGRVLLSVADTGIGIAAEDLPHVFERFYRADKSRSRADGHFGLGLAICKAMVNADGGTIDVTSQPGAGSTFTVNLPA